MKLLFFGTDDQFGLCPSYLRAARMLDQEVLLFDYQKSIIKNISFGKIGLRIHQHLHLENWVHRVNREFVVLARNYKPDVIFAVTNAPITPSAIMFLKTVLPGCRFVLIWPDSILNFKLQTINSLPLYDLIATYGSTSVGILKKVSNVSVQFFPLAGDLEIHGIVPGDQHLIDVGFVGGWRPERQKYLEAVVHHYPALKVAIYGPLWKEKSKNTNLKNSIKGNGLHGMKMASFFNTTLINLNVIDDTNYPSANMRFFEILAAGGLELVSSCPEMEKDFVDGEDLFYFNDENSMIEKIELILGNRESLKQIKMNGYNKIKSEHNYTERLKSILNSLT